MDNYQPNSMNSTAASHQYHSNLPGIAPSQLQHNLPPHTLPPLQNAAVSLYGGSAQQSPRNQNTAGSAAYSQMGNQAQRGNYGMQQPMRDMQSNPYAQSNQHFSGSSSMLPQSSVAMSHAQPIAPAPAQSRLPPVPLRPMPSGGLQMQSPLNPPYGHSQMMSHQSPMMQEPEHLTHVVGSQGRRGILPSAPGRPAVTATGTGSGKNAVVPVKDADGKFPCPHCTKTYLHAKHLKRHLLRHTGDRPYACPLCRDTFSRSDILKRHFQKCSIRRGNPTGASHLSHAQGHLKKNQQAMQKNAPGDASGMNNMSSEPSINHFGINVDGRMPDAVSNLTAEQIAEQERQASLKRMSVGGGRDRRSMTGPGPGGSSRASFDQNYGNEMSGSMNPQLSQFHMQNSQSGSTYGQNYDFGSHNNGLPQQGSGNAQTSSNGRASMPMFAGNGSTQQPGVDWSQVFQPNGQDGFMTQFNSHIAQPQVQIKTEFKTEPGLNNSNDTTLFTGMYPTAVPTAGVGNISGFPHWNQNTTHGNPYQYVSNQLLNFCFPPGSHVQHSETRNCLQPDSIRHFLELYTNFQGHFPIIHMSSFRVTETYGGLIMAMITIGAVYSGRVDHTQTRHLMELAKASVERNSRVYALISSDTKDNTTIGGGSKSDLEEMQAIFLLQIVFLWHGTPVQRENARRNFPSLIALVRKFGLTHPVKTSSLCSELHQPEFNMEQFNVADFDWTAWIEQEKRTRLVFTIFLVDCAMVLYFNMAPNFGDPYEICLSLPADDAAWDAKNSSDCADALGLHGPTAARDRNTEGSRRARQPEFHTALKTLMSGYELQPGSTNVYSKFVLIHALHVQVWNLQRQHFIDPTGTHQGMLLASAAGTPIAQNDWVSRAGDAGSSGTPSTNTSGRATPVDLGIQGASPMIQQMARNINVALDKFKKAWDEDMMLQYPPAAGNYKRFGFIRDGVHFYWLAKYLLRNSRASDHQGAPDQRMTYVMHLLKSVRNWVVSDSAKRGEDLGSISDIDKEYGFNDLTLDMAQLFKPINQQTDSPVTGVAV